MGMFRDRKTEVLCTNCDCNCKAISSHLTKYKGKLMQMQYRKCVVCGRSMTTYKDLDTKEIYYNGKVYEPPRKE